MRHLSAIGPLLWLSGHQASVLALSQWQDRAIPESAISTYSRVCKVYRLDVFGQLGSFFLMI
jgi:hypothetical protein